MPITLDGTNGITTPMYNGSITANAVTPSVNMKNRIINGAMVIDQRNAGASVTLPDGAGSYSFVTDRFACARADGATATGQQSSTAPTGFNNSLLITSGTGITVAASGQGYITHYIEGYNIADLGWGTANAKTVTLSFWVRSSITGTHSGALNNSAFNRSYPFTYTISSANTWEYKTVTIAGDTTGTWLTTNGRGIVVTFNNGSGSTYLGTAGAWAGSQLYGATGSVALNSVTSSTWYITGVQLEVGSTATSFDYRPYGTELALCQRYYQLLAKGANVYFCNAYYYGSTTIYGTTILPVTMRATPTSAIVSGTNYYTMYYNSVGDALNSFTISYSNPQNISFYNNSEASGTGGQAGGLFTENASSFIAVQAEL